VSAPTRNRPAPPAPDDVDDADLVVARTPHPWRWVISIAVLIVVAQFLHGLATNPGWDWATFAPTSPPNRCWRRCG